VAAAVNGLLYVDIHGPHGSRNPLSVTIKAARELDCPLPITSFSAAMTLLQINRRLGYLFLEYKHLKLII
jgi:hypothetical protein